MANYPVPYQSTWNYSGVGQQMYPQYPQGQNYQQIPQTVSGGTAQGLIWVDGEVGAKAYQLPAGLPANQPVALWDTNDTIIYLKSVNPVGMPNPIQKAHYSLENGKGGETSRAFSGDAERDGRAELPDMSRFVTKEDLNQMKQDLMEALNGISAPAAGRRTMKGE